jgi:hypothetical protein
MHHIGGLFASIQVIADVMHAAAGRSDYRIVIAEAYGKMSFRLGGRRLIAAISHRLTAASLSFGEFHLMAQSLQYLQRGNSNLGKEGVDIARYEQADLHREPLLSAIPR